MISIKYIKPSLMFKASTDERVEMIWINSLSCLKKKKNSYDFAVDLDKDLAASFNEGQ